MESLLGIAFVAATELTLHQNPYALPTGLHDQTLAEIGEFNDNSDFEENTHYSKRSRDCLLYTKKDTNCGLFIVNTWLHYFYLTWKRS